jgi:hypothetical protein
MKTTKKKQFDVLGLLRKNQNKASKKPKQTYGTRIFDYWRETVGVAAEEFGIFGERHCLTSWMLKENCLPNLRQIQRYSKLLNKPKSGRKTNTTPEVNKEIVKLLCNEDRTITSAQITAMLKQKYSDFHRALYANVWFPLVYLDEWLVGNLFCAFVGNYLNKKETDSTLSVIQDWPSQSPDLNTIK